MIGTFFAVLAALAVFSLGQHILGSIAEAISNAPPKPPKPRPPAGTIAPYNWYCFGFALVWMLGGVALIRFG